MPVAAEVRLALGEEIDPEVFQAELEARYCLKSFPPGQECDWLPLGAASMMCSRCGSVELEVPRGIMSHVRHVRAESDARHARSGLLTRVYRGLQQL